MNEDESAKTENTDLLAKLKAEVFDGSSEQLAEALGRPVEEIRAWFTGVQQIDEDAEMKIHVLAQERLSE